LQLQPEYPTAALLRRPRVPGGQTAPSSTSSPSVLQIFFVVFSFYYFIILITDY
jgi:hypothetical protein